jgi:hypothetical protein
MCGCINLTIFLVFRPFQYSGASMSAESVNLENRCNLTCYGASEQASVAPYSPHRGVRNPWRMLPYDNHLISAL